MLLNIREWKIYKILTNIAIKIYCSIFANLLICFVLYMFYSGFLAFLVFLSFALAILYNAQDNILFHPHSPKFSRIFVPVPSQFGLPFESVNIKTKDAVHLHAYFIRHPGQKGDFLPTMIYFHGNAGNAGHRLQNASGIYHNLQCNILLVEYRGYGLSTGAPSEKGIYIDARSSIDYLFTRHDLDHSQIVLFGRSLGGAVCIDLAADSVYGSKIMCVIVENTFTSIQEMAVHLVHPYIKYVPLCFYKNKFTSISKIQHIQAPVLFISGLEDNLVPSSMMSMLHSKCGSTHKQLLQIAGGSHNDTWAVSGYYQGIAQFLMECKEIKGPMKTPPVRLNLWPQIQEV